MRVFVDARMAGSSGIGVMLDALLCAWRDEPPPFDLTLMGGGPLIAGIFHDAPGRSAERVRFVPWTARMYSPAAALHSIAQHGAKRGDVFFSPHYATTLNSGLPLVCYVQDVIHWSHPPRRGTSSYSRTYFAALRRRAAYVLTPSRHVKVQLQTMLGFPAHRVLRVPLGPGGAHDSAQPFVPHTMPDGAPYFISLGLYKTHKNWDFMLERLAGLWAAGRIPHRLVAGGLGSPPARERFARKLASLGIADRVQVLEHLPADQLAAYIAGATALLFPSLAEGFGLPILEAQRAGTPVLIADREPMTEVAGAGALLFDPDQPTTFDGGVVQLAEDAALRAQLFTNGRENVAHYAWKKTANHVAEVLVRASAEGRA